MKKNLNQLKKILSEFRLARGDLCKFKILDDILYFGCPKIWTRFQHEVSGEIKELPARTSTLEFDSIEYSPGTDFFRVRKLEQEILHPKNEDFWTPPSRYPSRGRLNNPNEALLYISTETETALLETETCADDSYLLIIYKSLEKISLTQVKMKSGSSKDSVENTKCNFFNTLFYKQGAYAHVMSRFISHRYASWTSDGWRYSSTKKHVGNNICLKSPISIKKLSITCVLQLTKGAVTALHYVDSKETITSVRDTDEIRSRVESLSAQFTRGLGVAIPSSRVDVAFKCLTAIN